MALRNSMLFVLIVLAGVSASSLKSVLAQEPAQARVVPLKKTPKLAMDKRYETVSGDPAKSGAPFVIRIHAEAGYIVMPHTHPEDENIVVVKGSWALGMGDHFNRDTLEPMETGDYGFAGKKMAHFGLSKTDSIIQVHGIGPFTTYWVAPVYELSDKGVLMKTRADDPGRAMPASPDGCFELKLGERVHASYGEGVVIGAQCTPGQITQYRVEKPDGERFWAQREELQTRSVDPAEITLHIDQEGSRATNPGNSRIRRVSSSQVAEPAPGTWSNCLVVNGVAYISGMVARDKDGMVILGDEYDQAKLSFAKIRSLVEAAGGTMADVVKLTIFVTDIKQREKVWRARREFFSGDFPASTLVQVAALAEPSIKVEIEAIAHIGAGIR